MTLLDAKEYAPARERKRRTRIITSVVLLVILAFLGWWFRYWPEECIGGHFFDALQKQNYDTAYGIWMHDPHWRQHADRNQKYPCNEFYQDWGPGGEWGLIKSHKRGICFTQVTPTECGFVFAWLRGEESDPGEQARPPRLAVQGGRRACRGSLIAAG
jgi:hypothetical protein